jgi:hypothetical protein
MDATESKTSSFVHSMSPDEREPLFTHELLFIPIPKRLRYHDGKSFHFGLLLNVSLGFASTVSAWLIACFLDGSEPGT